jgi:hypothetical protein
MQLLHRLGLCLLVAMVACTPITVSGDVRGDALVRQAGERLISSIPLFVSYNLTITRDATTYASACRLHLRTRDFIPTNAWNSSLYPSGLLSSLIRNMGPVSAFAGNAMDTPVEILSTRYIGTESLDGQVVDVVELVESVHPLGLEVRGHVEHPIAIARARIRWYLDERRFVRRVKLMGIEPIGGDNVQTKGLPPDLQGRIRAAAVVTDMRRPYITAPRRALPAARRNVGERNEAGRERLTAPEMLISPDGSLVARLTSSTVEVVELRTGRSLFVHRPLERGPRAAVFSPDGSHIAVTNGNTVLQLNTQTGAADRAEIGRQSMLFSVSYSPDGQRIAASCMDEIVGVWGSRTGELEQTLNHSAGAVAFSPDGTRLATFGHEAEILLWDTVSWQIIQRLDAKGGNNLYQMAFSPDGKWIAALADDREIRLFDGSTEHPQRTVRGIGSTRQIAWTPAGYLLTMDIDERSDNIGPIGVTYWQPQTGRMHSTFALPSPDEIPVASAQIVRGGRQLLFRDFLQQLSLIDLKAK